MWIQLLKELRGERATYPVGTIFWLRRAGFITCDEDGNYAQQVSRPTIEDRKNRFVMILHDGAEGDLYKECNEPVESELHLIA